MTTKVMLRRDLKSNKEIKKFRNVILDFVPQIMSDKKNVYFVEGSEYRVDRDTMYIYVTK